MIGKKAEITKISDLIRALQITKAERIKVLEQASAKDVEAYMRQNSQLSHDVIVVSSKK